MVQRKECNDPPKEDSQLKDGASMWSKCTTKVHLLLSLN